MLSVACHPSGKVFATGSSDARVKLWDLQTRTCAQTIPEHSDQVSVPLNDLSPGGCRALVLQRAATTCMQVICARKPASATIFAGA